MGPLRTPAGASSLATGDLPDLPTALLAATLFIVSANWHRLQRRFNQTECDTQVMQPVLDFLFHDAPLQGRAERPKFCSPFALIIVRSPTQCSLKIAMICY